MSRPWDNLHVTARPDFLQPAERPRPGMQNPKSWEEINLLIVKPPNRTNTTAISTTTTTTTSTTTKTTTSTTTTTTSRPRRLETNSSKADNSGTRRPSQPSWWPRNPNNNSVDDYEDNDNGSGGRSRGRGGGRRRRPTTRPESHDGQRNICDPSRLGQHEDYIRDNLDRIKQTCQGFHSCLNVLYGLENPFAILAGEDLGLDDICGVLYGDSNTVPPEVREKCPVNAAFSIRDDVANDFASTLSDPPKTEDLPTWRRLNKCLKDNNQTVTVGINKSERDLNILCRLKRDSPSEVCDDRDVDDLAQKFVNQKLTHLHCTCNAVTEVPKENSSLPLMIGAAVGGVIFLIFIIIIIVMCRRHKKVKRQMKRQQALTIIDTYAVYQEIPDNSHAIEALRKEREQRRQKKGSQAKDEPPSLPSRYVKDISKSQTNLAEADTTDDHDYLEPLPDISHIKPGQSFTSDALPPGFVVENAVYLDRDGRAVYVKGKSVYDVEKKLPAGESDTGSYIPLLSEEKNTPKPADVVERPASAVDEDGGYSTLGRKSKVVEERSSAEESADKLLPKESQYYMLEPETNC